MQSSLRRTSTLLTPRRILSTRSFSTSLPPRSSTSRTDSIPTTTSNKSDESSTTSRPSHYLVTLLRSPLHLDPSIESSLTSLGLYKRLSSSIVPITPTNQGYLLKAKELIQIRPVTEPEVREYASQEWRERPGEGRQGSGLRVRQGAGSNAVIRVGSERARGEERGFKIVQ